MPEQVALDGFVGISVEMDRGHFRIDLELAERREKEILGRDAVGRGLGIAQEQAIARRHHEIHHAVAQMDGHFIIRCQRGRGFHHTGNPARTGLGPGIKKNCLITRQFQTFYRFGLLKDDDTAQKCGRLIRREEPFRNQGILEHYSQLPALLLALSIEPTIRPG